MTPTKPRSPGKPILLKSPQKSFGVVAIGASAGGLEAVTILLKNLPPDTGMAYIYVQHISPDHKSFLSVILGKLTSMKVQEVEDMDLIAPDNLYIIPHNKEIKVIDGHIQLLPRTQHASTNLSVDVLFASLAATHKANTVGIILSGYAHDGTSGLKAIKDAGGITFAQDDSAQAGSMPQSAIASGIVDFILSPKQIALELALIGKHGIAGYVVSKVNKTVLVDNNNELKDILHVLFKKTGVDFSHYKMASVKRRLSHRIQQSATKNISDYLKLISEDNNESELLRDDLLINVTAFFRDKEVFSFLKTDIFPKILNDKKPGESIRIWVPACATGEEAYTIAMLLIEIQQDRAKKVPVQIFATDLSKQAILKARMGEYEKKSLNVLSSKTLEHFFTKNGDAYLISKEVREMCVFAPHNILNDPPFSKMDFISCRNLLIYFDAAAQAKALATLHFGLVEKGYLMLAKAETTGSSSQFFTQVDQRFKIYSRKLNTGIQKVPQLLPRLPRASTYEKNIISVAKKNISIGSQELDNAINAIVSPYMPACAVINKEMEIFQFRGSTSLFLTHPPGKASLNILKMTRPECALQLRSAIHLAIKTKQPVIKSGIEIKIGSAFQMMSLEVSPLNIEWDEPLLLVVFTLQQQIEKFVESSKRSGARTSQKDDTIKRLNEELNNLSEEMTSIIETYESTYQELQAAHEEIVSTNEEFQALNEELETSKEEIEATNEEIMVTNQELHLRNDMLLESYNYSQSIAETVHEPMLILDNSLHIKSANRAFYKKFISKKEDIEGVFLFDLGDKQWDIPKLRERLENMLLKNLEFENFEVTHEFPGIGKKTMLLNAHPIIQKTHQEQSILLAFEDITERILYYTNEKERLEKDINSHEAENIKLEKIVAWRTNQLTLQNRELENANKDLTSFTHISSHDLQEPLRKIQNFISLLLEKEAKNLSDAGKGYLQKVDETSKGMRGLLNDLLEYSRTTETGQHFELINLSSIITDVKKDYEEVINEMKGEIEVGILCDATVNLSQFTQVIQNLISNSLKFSKKEVPPYITIKSAIVHGSSLNVGGLSYDAEYCHIIYTDNGIGFDPKYKDRIFEVFQRLHAKEDYQGTGMGLAICKRIVENHNGVITATGKLGKGARFDIYIQSKV